MSHYGNPNYNRQPSKLAQTILDPKQALKSAINNALTDSNRQPAVYQSSAYAGSGPSPYTGPNNFNNSQSSFGQTNTTTSPYPGGPTINSTFSTSPPPRNPSLSQPIPHRPHSGLSFTSTSPPPSFSQIETPAAVIDSLLPPGRKSSPLLSHSRPHTPLGRDEHVQVNVPHEGENIHLDITLHSDGNQISRPSSRVSQVPSRDIVSTTPAYATRPALTETVITREVSTPQPQSVTTFRTPNLSGLGPPTELSFPQSNMNMGMQGMGMMGMNMGMMGQNPMMSMNQSAPASKMYHRMINDYSTLRSGYYSAKINPAHGDLSAVIARLRALSREIWSLRHNRASEFNCTDAHHEFCITMWKAEFEMWSDLFEDCYDPMQAQMQQMIDAQTNYADMCGLGSGDSATKKKKSSKSKDGTKKKSSSKTKTHHKSKVAEEE